jgi:predicted metalloprotease with PDZ domain
MPRGLRRAGAAASLEERDDIDSTYWGGALFALLADVRIRKATGGAHSLDDVVRGALAQMGDSTHVGSVARFLSIGDAVVGGHVLADLYTGYAMGGEAVDLEALWRELGVDGEPQRTLHEAPLASLRRAVSSNAGARY